MCMPLDHSLELLRSSVSCVTYPVSNPIGSVGQPEVDMYSPYVPEGQVTGSLISTLKEYYTVNINMYKTKRDEKHDLIPSIQLLLKRKLY